MKIRQNLWKPIKIHPKLMKLPSKFVKNRRRRHNWWNSFQITNFGQNWWNSFQITNPSIVTRAGLLSAGVPSGHDILTKFPWPKSVDFWSKIGRRSWSWVLGWESVHLALGPSESEHLSIWTSEHLSIWASEVQMLRCSDVQMFRCSDVQKLIN